MKTLRVLYETVWFRCHPITGPVSPADPSPVIYPTWRMSYELAKGLYG